MIIKFQNESEWLERRKTDVTSTEIAALFGLHSHKSRLRLWHEKKGDIESDFVESPFTILGNRFQNVIGEYIAEQEGWTAEDMGLLYMTHHSLNLGASLDFKVKCPERGNGLLEVKRTTAFSEDAGWTKERAPLPYEFQIQAQLHLADRNKQDIDFGCIGALGGHSDTRKYFRTYDAALGGLMEEEVNKFWESIRLDEPPTPDYAVDADVIRQLQGDVDIGRTVSLTSNNRAADLITTYLMETKKAFDIGEMAVQHEAAAELCKAELQHIMGTAERAIIGDYRISAPETVVEERFVHGYRFRRFDVKKLKTGRKKP